jgi:choline dehydrogenase-like flavoprotein
MAVVTVVGSGPSGVHFADAVLSQGHEVRLLDVGTPPPETVSPESTLEGLKDALEDPVAYFLGNELEGVIQPDHGAEYYGLPPSKAYVFDGADRLPVSSDGFEPLFSWARGGLAQAWTGGCYPFNEAELRDFPFDFETLAPYYDEVAARIGISGADDDLGRFIPVHAHLDEPLALDRHAQHLLDRYAARRTRLNRMGLYVGRSRVSVLTAGRREPHREPCGYLGRCLWGCPRRSLYTPSMTLQDLRARPRFEYLPGRVVRRFRFDPSGRIEAVVWTEPEGGPEHEEPVDVLALAAGTLSSARIFLESWRDCGRGAARLTGLMDNRQVMVPFLTPARIGHRFEPESYQYNLVAMGLGGARAEEYVHCLVTTLKTALVHPIVQSLPLDLRTASWVFRQIRAALGLVNVNFHDRRRDDCFVELGGGDAAAGATLRIEYRAPADEQPRVGAALGRLTRGLRSLGAVVPPGMTRWRPMGASVHYSGTLPMTRSSGRFTTDASCRSRDFENLWIVDGSTFPFLPAKNLTFTLMANARRIAATAFRGGRVHR